MPEADDMDLVRDFARTQSEAAFTELVRRHINLVYSVARRCTGDDSDAQDVTQAVFIILARKAAGLRARPGLTGWVYETTRLTAAHMRRTNARRHAREQEAYMQSNLNEADSAAVWEKLSPHLEAAMSKLAEHDRALLVLRFYEHKSGSEAAALLGIHEDAAHKRLTRAIEKLRKVFVQRGVTLTATAIAAAVSANSVQAAPVAMVKTISAVAVVKGAAAATSTLTLVNGALKIMAWTKAKTAIVTAAIIVCVAGGGAGVYVFHSSHRDAASELRAALNIQNPETGTWAYPADQVRRAIVHFGSNRASAFPILEMAVKGPNPEARKQAVAVMQLVGRPARPLSGLLGDSSPEVRPFLWQILNANNAELSSFALASLRAIGFQPKDIPNLAGLLGQSHDDRPLQTALARVNSLQAAQNVMAMANGNQDLQRYLPEAIAETIERNPDADASFISPVENLLDDANAGVRFGAACALAKYLGVNNPKISAELIAGLKSRHDNSSPYAGDEGLKQLMAIETLQRIGPDAKPLIPALLEFANSKSINDKLLHELAFRAAGHIDSNLRNDLPEVDQALKDDPNLKNATSQKKP